MSVMWIERLNEFDPEDGTLKAAGVTWIEFNAFLWVTAWLIIMFCVVWGALALAFPTRVETPIWKPTSLALASYLIAKAGTRHRRRALMFELDGGMALPFGLATRPARDKRIGGHHDYIASIEQSGTGGQPPSFSVEMFDGAGNIIPVANGLSREDSHKISVQLNQALGAIREAKMNAQRGGRPWAG